MATTAKVADAVNHFLGLSRRSISEIAKTGTVGATVEEWASFEDAAERYSLSLYDMAKAILATCRAAVAAEGL